MQQLNPAILSLFHQTYHHSARQYYAKLGVATSSQPPTEASFAVDSDTQVIIDQLNWQTGLNNPSAIED